MQKLTNKEKKVRRYVFELFIPSLHQIIRSLNHSEYQRWGGNTCRQSAIFGAYFLDQWLPEYEWEVYDGNFTDVINGKEVAFNHAWIYGVSKNGGANLFLDLSNVLKERLFIKTNVNAYPKDHEEYKNQKEVSRVQLDWRNMVGTEREYYTRLQTQVLADLLREVMLFNEDKCGLGGYVTYRQD